MKRLISIAMMAACVQLATAAPVARQGNEGGGGGNTLNGKPIESYIGDITQYASYKKVITPLLDKLSKKLPQLAAELKATTTDKLWYFVPTHLDRLPKNVTGINFKSDQVIVQSRRSVWVNKAAFDSLAASEPSQSTLILHELVMGLVMDHRNNPLTADDHDIVRAVTIYLLKNQDASADELRNGLEENGFGEAWHYVQLRDSLIQGPSSLQELYHILKLANGKVIGGCDGQFSYDETNHTLQARIFADDSVTTLTLTQGPSYYTSESSSNDLIYTAVEGGNSGVDGELRKVLWIMLGKRYFDGYGDGWAICRDLSHSGTCSWKILIMNAPEIQRRRLKWPHSCPQSLSDLAGIDLG